MDNIKFGCFIAGLRKEKGMTQNELAKLLCVTDKAVSKWERGAGFPDIKLIESLAHALDVSVIEIMNSEKNIKEEFSRDNYVEAINNLIDISELQRRIEHRNYYICSSLLAVIIMLIFLIDNMQIEGFLFTCLPIVMAVIGIFLLGIGVCRKKQGKNIKALVGASCVILSYPILIIVILFWAMYLGRTLPK